MQYKGDSVHYKAICLLIAYIFVEFMIADSPIIQQHHQKSLSLEVLEGDFITEKEYGKYLYENPRGISCRVCHGEYGEGTILATYKHRGKEKELHAPNITGLDIKEFKAKVNNAQGVMPKYYLTDSEIEAIYEYITK